MDRRQAIKAGCVACAGTVVAACGGGGTSPTTSGDDQVPATSGPGSPDGQSASGALADTADVPVGSAVILTEVQLVVTQPTAGEFYAYSAVCPHQGCVVREVREQTIVCPCHGSEFQLDGAVQRGPALRGLEPRAIRVEGTSIVPA
ncbi:QcrA and Rieske domain-containing protein [Lolliginicoccus lacisalsi]|uniref:QcrA and Rieske domain-containing protein n=1 Tax=Lolliginicoccus lacisalsi TaxID=2742202 RepID=UPI002FD5DB0A